MKFPTGPILAGFLMGCGGTAKLPPTYTIVKGKGILYTRFSEQNAVVFSTLTFKNMDSNTTVEHVIDRRTLGSRENFVAKEMIPGNWRFLTFRRETTTGSQTSTFMIKDSLAIDFSITADQVNYLPYLDIQISLFIRT